MSRSTEEARNAIRAVLDRSGLSMRALSVAMARDPGYIAAYLDPNRPSRARPTPDDLAAASGATGISLTELLEGVWGIPPGLLADELAALGLGTGLSIQYEALSARDRAAVADYVEFLAARRRNRAGGDRVGGPNR